MGAATSPAEAWDIEKGIEMLSFHHTLDLPYEVFDRYPDSERLGSAPRQARSAMQINLDVRRARRAETLGR